MTAMPGYIFYDYQDVNGNPRTLVYDEQAKGWTVDGYTPSVNTHSWAVGVVSQIFTGCADGTVRAMTSSGSEVGNAVVVTPSINGGSARTLKRIGGVVSKGFGEVRDCPDVLCQPLCHADHGRNSREPCHVVHRSRPFFRLY